jgi:hypothetical protein
MEGDMLRLISSREFPLTLPNNSFYLLNKTSTQTIEAGIKILSTASFSVEANFFFAEHALCYKTK